MSPLQTYKQARWSTKFIHTPFLSKNGWCRLMCWTCSSGQQWDGQKTKLSLHQLLPEAGVWAVSQREPPAEKKKTKTTKDPPLLVTMAWHCQNRPGVEQDRWSPPKGKQGWSHKPTLTPRLNLTHLQQPPKAGSCHVVGASDLTRWHSTSISQFAVVE